MKLPLSRFVLTAFLAGIGLSGWLRLRHLGYTEMWSDQALVLNTALEWVHGGPLPLVSMKLSFGVFGPPLVEYLYALALAIRENVLSVLWLTALLNLAGVLVSGWATARTFGPRAGWWAMLLFAVCPWAAYYGRLIWLPTLVPFFSSVAFAFLLRYFADSQRPHFLVIALVAFAGAVQIHPTSILLLPVLLSMAALFPRRLRLAPIISGVGLAVLTFMPYLVFQFRTGFGDWSALLAGLGRPAQVNAASVLILIDLLQSKGVYYTMGSGASLWHSLDWEWLGADKVIAVWLALAAAWALARVVQDFRSRQTGGSTDNTPDLVLTVLWLAWPLVLTIRHSHPLQNYYFLFVFPAPFVLLAVFSDRLFRAVASRLRGGARFIAHVSFLPLAIVGFQQARLDWIGESLRAAGVAGGQRVVDVQAAIDRANGLMAERQACSFVVISEGTGFESSRFALMREFVRHGAGVRFVAADRGRLIPSTCAVYFSVTPDESNTTWLRSIARPLPEATVRTPGETWTFHDFPTMDHEQVLAELISGAPLGVWDGRVALIGATFPITASAGDSLTILTTWEIQSTVVSPPVHFGNYLLNQDGHVVAQMDGPGVDSGEWRVGDVLQTEFRLFLPPGLPSGEYNLATALYHWPSLERLSVNGADLLTLGHVTVP